MIEREQIPMDVVFVGAGPANLAAALHLKNEIKKHDELVEKGLRQGRVSAISRSRSSKKARSSVLTFCPVR